MPRTLPEDLDRLARTIVGMADAAKAHEIVTARQHAAPTRTSPATPTVKEKRSMREFQPEDQAPAAEFYRAVTDPTAKAILDYLIDHPDERFNGAALVRALDLPEHRAVARATYAMGQTAAAQGRKRPWTEAPQGYLMPAPIADLFRQVRR